MSTGLTHMWFFMCLVAFTIITQFPADSLKTNGKMFALIASKCHEQRVLERTLKRIPDIRFRILKALETDIFKAEGGEKATAESEWKLVVGLLDRGVRFCANVNQSTCGFQILVDHLPETVSTTRITQWLKNHNVNVIAYFPYNPLRTAITHSKFSRKSLDYYNSKNRVTLDVDKISERVLKVIRREAEWEMALRLHLPGKNILLNVKEMYINDSNCRRLLQFLNINLSKLQDTCSAEILQQHAPQLFSHFESNCTSHVMNWNAISSGLKNKITHDIALKPYISFSLYECGDSSAKPEKSLG